MMRRVLKRMFHLAVYFVLLGWGCGVLIWGLDEVRLAELSETWPSVPGVVVESSVVGTRGGGEMDRARDFHANVRYRYSVNGVAYQAERIRFGTVVGGRDFAQAIVARYPPGKSVTVFFDGARPSEARLERSSFGLLTGAYMGIVIGGLAILILGVIGFLFLWHWIEGLWKRDRASAE